MDNFIFDKDASRNNIRKMSFFGGRWYSLLFPRAVLPLLAGNALVLVYFSALFSLHLQLYAILSLNTALLSLLFRLLLLDLYGVHRVHL